MKGIRDKVLHKTSYLIIFTQFFLISIDLQIIYKITAIQNE